MNDENSFSNKPFLKTLFVVLVCIGFVLFMALSGCYTERKGVKQSVRAYTYYPGSIAGLHSVWFPIRDSVTERTIYKPGAVQWRYDTVTADCEGLIEAIKNQVTLGEPQKSSTIIRVPCPPCAISVDTLEHYREISKESTAKLQAKDKEAKDLTDKIIEKEKTISSQQKALNISLWSLFALGSYTIIRWIANKWLKINLP